jgi:hypothetical protein
MEDDRTMSKILQSVDGPAGFTPSGKSGFDFADKPGPVFSKRSGDPTRTQLWTPLLGELLRFRNLKNDWDGEGTEAPSPGLIERAIALATDLQKNGCVPADHVCVSVNATIYFEWQSPLGYEEIEVTSPDDAEYRWAKSGSDEVVVIRLSPTV